MMKAVNDGMATLDESFPPLAAEPDKKAERSAESGRKLDEFAAGDAATDPVAEPSLKTEGAGAAVPPTTAPASGSPDPEAPAADPGPQEQLLHDLRGAAMRGAKALRFAIAKLSVEQQELITTEDRAGLEAAAKAAG